MRNTDRAAMAMSYMFHHLHSRLHSRRTQNRELLQHGAASMEPPTKPPMEPPTKPPTKPPMEPPIDGTPRDEQNPGIDNRHGGAIDRRTGRLIIETEVQ